MKIGVVGLGYWGPNIVRNFLSNPKIKAVTCFDLNSRKLEGIRKNFPSVETTSDYKHLLSDHTIEAVAIVTPVSTHYPLAKEALEAGKHVLLEKPMADTAAHAEHLIELAEKKNLRLMVDHTFIYNGAVRKIKELIESGEIGDLYYFDSVRVNLGLFQHDVNVIWDLAPHDLSIMDYLIGKKPIAVSAVGVSHFNHTEDVAYITVHFEDAILAHFHVNWLSPVKVRKMLIGGNKKMVVYDDMEPSEKVKVYDKGVEIQSEEMVHRLLVQYRMGDMYAPQLDQTEALRLMIKEFVDSIEEKRKPLTDGEAGLAVVRILEAADASIKAGSKAVNL